MSGSDPSVRRNRHLEGSADLLGAGAGGRAGGDESACPGPPFETVLASPFPDVVAQLEVGDLLDVVAIEEPVRGVVAQTLDGEVVGAVTRDIRFLRGCLNEGCGYEADVLRIAGGSVSVLIRGRMAI